MIKKVYGSLESIVNICVLGKMRIAALISKENLLFQHSSAALEFFVINLDKFG